MHLRIQRHLWKRTKRTAATIALSAIIAAAAPAQDLTLDRVLAKNQDAVGGSTAINQVQTLRLTTSTTLGGDPAKVAMTITLKRPNLTRMDSLSQGKAVASGFDGKSAWVINPATGVAESMNLGKTASGSLTSFQIDGILGSLNGILSGQQTHLMGVEVVQGANAYHLQATRTDGIVSDYYVDQTTYLIVKSTTQIPQDNGTQTVESYPTDYRKVNGLMCAYSLDVKIAGELVFRKQVQQVETNPTIDDSTFKMPSAPVK
jgi:outer membrane lipoprotein-sorting protein